ncbi:MAG: site-specific DNA-methyltransferase [Candidatus Brocadiia bacterium]
MIRILEGDCVDQLKVLGDESVNCCVTSPPYWGLRNYGHPGQLGLESTPEEYVAKMVAVFGEVRRVLRNDGTLWLNMGDTYAANNTSPKSNLHVSRKQKNCAHVSGLMAPMRPQPDGLKPKDLVGIPWRVAFALQAAGWYLRQDIIWHKPNPMPESVKDRCTKSHEYIFLLAKSGRYYYDADAIKEISAYPKPDGKARDSLKRYENESGRKDSGRKANGQGYYRSDNTRNKRSVWTVATQPYKEAHFATFPPALITPCILAGCPQGGTVLDPFAGSGTTGEVAEACGRNSILIELKLIRARSAQRGLFCGKSTEES